jgi:hypothetical protein
VDLVGLQGHRPCAFGSEDKPQVEVLMGRLALDWVRRNGMYIDIDWNTADRCQIVGRDTGFFYDFACGGFHQAGVASLKVAARAQPPPE